MPNCLTRFLSTAAAGAMLALGGLIFSGSAMAFNGISGGLSFSSIVANCNPAEGIPVIHFHGTADSIVDYDNGVLDSLGAEDSLEAWRQIQSCGGTSEFVQLSSNTTCQVYSDCNDGAQVAMCTVQGGSHGLYGDVNGAGIPTFAWDFFQGGF